jgi:hypothetical protein
MPACGCRADNSTTSVPVDPRATARPRRGRRTRSERPTAATVDTRIKDVDVTDETITARFVDGRAISVPLAWSWRLAAATPAQRANWELIGDGHGVHWPDIDEDLSADGLLHGVPARRPHRPTPPTRARDTNRRRTGSR